MATKKHCFHSLYPLQNARALSLQLFKPDNQKAVVINERIQYSKPQAKQRLMYKARPPVNRQENNLLADKHQVSPFSTHRLPYQLKVEQSRKNRSSQQYFWKKGHGTIEKVDKMTGEIYHLCHRDNEELL